MSLVATEHVLVVPTDVFHRLGHFQGFCGDTERYLRGLLDPQHTSYRPRSEMEQDPSFKQLIPYVLLVHAGRILHYVRGKKGGENRLHARGSIGVGGHLNDTDENLFSWDEEAYRAGVAREVMEELVLPTGYRERVVALLNDDSNEVGRVHLGIVHVFDLETNRVTARETVLTRLEFLSPDELRARRESLETWSQLCVDRLDDLVNASA